jgi:hypothetical protein
VIYKKFVERCSFCFVLLLFKYEMARLCNVIHWVTCCGCVFCFVLVVYRLKLYRF